MKKKIIIRSLLVFLLMVLPGLFASAQEPTGYKVVKGDTLWGISGAKLNDPFLWPGIWKENPDISNPHLIYPGQVVRIPAYLMKGGENMALEQAREESAPSARAHTKNLAVAPSGVPAKPLPSGWKGEPAAKQRYKDIRGVVLYDRTVVEGEVLFMNAETVKLRTCDGRVVSFSFINEVENFIR